MSSTKTKRKHTNIAAADDDDDHDEESRPLVAPSSSSSSSSRKAAKKSFDVLMPDNDAVDLKAYRCGNIVRITMKNFMPYSDVTVHPGPRLNMVLAPNGIGKSTMVCAICIGLAGDPKSLGRAEQVKDFVKHGESEGSIELELFCGDAHGPSLAAPILASQSISAANGDDDDDDNDEKDDSDDDDDDSKSERKRSKASSSSRRAAAAAAATSNGRVIMRDDPRKGRNARNWTIRRMINIENKSKWFIDNKPVTEKQVRTLVRQLNIQVDNKCCFLSQDGVKSFAKMSPDRLLIELQDTIDPTLREQHKALCSLKKDSKSSVEKLEDLKRQAQAKDEVVTALKVDVDRMEQQELTVARLELLKKKKPWVILRMAVDEMKKLDDIAKTAAKQVKDEEARLGPTAQRLSEAVKARDQLNVRMTAVRDAFTLDDQKRRDLGDAVDQSEDTTSRMYQEILSIEDRKNAAIAQVERLRNDVEKRRQQLASAVTPDVYRQRILQVEQRTEKLRSERDDIDQRINDIRRDEQLLKTQEKDITTKLERQRDVRQRKLQRAHPTEQKLYHFVQEELKKNHDQFHGRVFGPVFMEVEVKDPLHCKYIEKCLPQWVQLAYVVEQKADWVHLSDITKHIGRINVIHVPQSEEDIEKAGVRRSVDARQFSEMGVVGFLDETVECHLIVMRGLRDHSAISQSGFTNVEHPKVEQALENGHNRGFRSLYTPENVFNVAVSKYGARAVSTSVVSLSGIMPRLFAPADGVDSNQFEDELKKLAARASELQEHRHKLDDDSRPIATELNKLSDERKTLVQESRKAEHLQGEVRKAENMLRQAETEENKQDDREIVHLRGQIRKENMQRLKHVMALDSMLQEWSDRAMLRDATSLSVIQSQSLADDADRHHRHAVRGMKQLTDRRDATNRDAAAGKDKAKRLQRQAMKDAPQEEWFDRFKNSVEPVPDDLKELDTMIADVQASVEVNQRGQDPTLKPRFLQAQREREELKYQIETLDAEIRGGTTRAQELLDKWTTKLKNAVFKVNVGFAGYFKDMGCEGEIKLGEHGDDYEKYCLEIWVSYRPREQPLALLTAESQSGGERSVATMLFLLSLQHVTGTPFRVVDEINQGMDARNERMVFDQMVRSTLHGDTPQYFLVTPKLLPSLDYSSAITVLFILSGSWMVNQDQWEAKSKSSAPRRRSAAAAHL